MEEMFTIKPRFRSTMPLRTACDRKKALVRFSISIHSHNPSVKSSTRVQERSWRYSRERRSAFGRRIQPACHFLPGWLDLPGPFLPLMIFPLVASLTESILLPANFLPANFSSYFILTVIWLCGTRPGMASLCHGLRQGFWEFIAMTRSFQPSDERFEISVVVCTYNRAQLLNQA